MDTKDAGRKGGLSRSAAKRNASRRNIAKARAITAKALELFKQQKPAPEILPKIAPPIAVLLVSGNGGK